MESIENPKKKASPWLEAAGYGCATLLVAGVVLGSLRILPGLTAFYLFALGGLFGLVVSALTLIQALRGHGLGPGRALGFGAMLTFVVSALLQESGPTTNDFTTDLREPPGFVHAAQLEPNRGRSLEYDPSFAEPQRECCADLKTLRLPTSLPESFARALSLAKQMPGWQVTSEAPGEGRIEAVAETRVFGFKDDIVIRLRAAGSGTDVDVRSKSRDGRGDLGANAKRIRAYLSKLAENA